MNAVSTSAYDAVDTGPYANVASRMASPAASRIPASLISRFQSVDGNRPRAVSPAAATSGMCWTPSNSAHRPFPNATTASARRSSTSRATELRISGKRDRSVLMVTSPSSEVPDATRADRSRSRTLSANDRPLASSGRRRLRRPHSAPSKLTESASHQPGQRLTENRVVNESRRDELMAGWERIQKSAVGSTWNRVCRGCSRSARITVSNLTDDGFGCHFLSRPTRGRQPCRRA